jgi:hypothetical protein
MSNNVAGSRTASMISLVKGSTLQIPGRKYTDAANLVGEDLSEATVQAWLYQTSNPDRIIKQAEVVVFDQTNPESRGKFQINMQTAEVERNTYLLQLRFAYPEEVYEMPSPVEVRIE